MTGAQPAFVSFVRGCECCQRNVPLSEFTRGEGLCRPCRDMADSRAAQLEALRLDRLGLKLLASFVFGLVAIGMLALVVYR